MEANIEVLGGQVRFPYLPRPFVSWIDIALDKLICCGSWVLTAQKTSLRDKEVYQYF